MITGREILDLTEGQHRKPLLGSGEASPVRFGPVEFSGRLILATDGLLKYATRHDIAQRAMGVSASDAVDGLVAGLRLRSGALQDDVAIILLNHAVHETPRSAPSKEQSLHDKRLPISRSVVKWS
jgi:PPM family protein phosphatase